MKTCNKCKMTLPLDRFYKARNGDQYGLMSWCKKCHAKNGAKYKANNRERLLAIERRRYKEKPHLRLGQKLRSRYGITLKQYQDMVEIQKGLCAVCFRPETSSKKRLSVDHNHETKKVRALLCHMCNAAIGYVKENPDIARNIATYLEAHK